MNIIINFYKELDTLNLIIFWGVIIVIILLLIFAIVISNKNRKLKLLLEKKEESHSNEKENIEITNNAIKENIVKEVYNEPIIPNDIKPHKDDTPKVLPENKEDKELFKKVSKETGYKYANTEIKKDKMLVYACSLEDCRDFA